MESRERKLGAEKTRVVVELTVKVAEINRAKLDLNKLLSGSTVQFTTNKTVVSVNRYFESFGLFNVTELCNF